MGVLNNPSRNIDSEMKFVLPIVSDASLQKMIIFSPKKLVPMIGEIVTIAFNI